MAFAVHQAVNVIKMGSWTSPFDARYQDETSEYKMRCDRIAAKKRGEEYTPKPWEGLPYLVKNDLGKIHVRGFLHDKVAANPDGTFTRPIDLPQEELLKRLPRTWNAHARACDPTKVTHHRLVFSMSKDFHSMLVRQGRNPDMVLRSIVERSMRAFQENFHRGDSVGYTYGLHHDTDNLHAHIFVHPRTREGKLVGMSEQLKKKMEQGASSRHKNQLKFLREAARKRAGQIVKEFTEPKAAAYLAHQWESEKVYFAPRRSHTAWPTGGGYRPVTPDDHALERLRQGVKATDAALAAKREAWRGMVRANRAMGVGYREPKWLRLLRRAQAATLFREMRELQGRRWRAMMAYRQERRRLLPLYGATRTMRRRTRWAQEGAPAQAMRPAAAPTIRLAVRPKPQPTPAPAPQPSFADLPTFSTWTVHYGRGHGRGRGF